MDILKIISAGNFAEMRAALITRKQEIEAGVLPLMAERDKLKEKIQPTEDKIRELNEKIKKFRGGAAGNELFEVTNGIAMLTRAIGGKAHRSIQAEHMQQDAEKPAEAE